MTTKQVNDLQYLVETNFPEDLTHVRVGSQFLGSDSRLIKNIETIMNANFKHCFLVTMERVPRYKPVIGSGRPEVFPSPVLVT